MAKDIIDSHSSDGHERSQVIISTVLHDMNAALVNTLNLYSKLTVAKRS